MSAIEVTVLAKGVAALAAFVAGVCADTWSFAALLAVCAYGMFRGAATMLGALPEFARSPLLSPDWFAATAGMMIGAVLFGLSGHMVRRLAAKQKIKH